MVMQGTSDTNRQFEAAIGRGDAGGRFTGLHG